MARHSIVTIWARLMVPLGFVPSEMPLSLDHSCAFSYQLAPPERSVSFCRAKIVHSWARVVELLGKWNRSCRSPAHGRSQSR